MTKVLQVLADLSKRLKACAIILASEAAVNQFNPKPRARVVAQRTLRLVRPVEEPGVLHQSPPLGCVASMPTTSSTVSAA